MIRRLIIDDEEEWVWILEKGLSVRIWDLEIQEWEIITWDHDLGSGIWYWDGYIR